MGQRISGNNFDVTVGDAMVHVETMSLSISDESTVTKNRGVPNGWVSGEVGAEGEMELDHTNFQLILDQAKKAGSWRKLPLFDITGMAKVGSEECKVEIFDCLVKVSDILDIDSKGGEKHTVKLPYIVTGKDFVRINGVPYLDNSEIENL